MPGTADGITVCLCVTSDIEAFFQPRLTHSGNGYLTPLASIRAKPGIEQSLIRPRQP